VRYFEADAGLSQTEGYAFRNKLDVLLTWSIALSQCGDHRPYVACTLLARWKAKETLRARRKGQQSLVFTPEETLQHSLFDWLDESDAARKHEETLHGVANLFGQLIHLGLFSYSRFVQKLMARGETGRAAAVSG
jgi:mediator of RNA polymerase II transcription subunit 12, fungi type